MTLPCRALAEARLCWLSPDDCWAAGKILALGSKISSATKRYMISILCSDPQVALWGRSVVDEITRLHQSRSPRAPPISVNPRNALRSHAHAHARCSYRQRTTQDSYSENKANVLGFSRWPAPATSRRSPLAQGSRRTAEQALNDGDLGASRLLPKRTLRLPDRPRAVPQREGDSGAGRRLEAAREMAVAGRWPGEDVGMIEESLLSRAPTIFG